MNTRPRILFPTALALFCCFTPSIFADSATDDNLKNLAIISTLLGWGLTMNNDKNPFSEALKINPHTHRFGFGQGNVGDVSFSQLFYGKDLRNTLIQASHVNLKGHWEFGIDSWRSTKKDAQQAEGIIIRAIPVYTLEPNDSFSHLKIKPYAEFGVGVNYLSSSVIENTQKSSQFHFVEYLGTGLRIGNLTLGYRFMHISNAGINLPNPATDMHKIHISYQFVGS